MKKLLWAVSILLAATTAFAEPSLFSVVVKGKGRPMILIPGLSSPGEVWDETIAHYSDRYETNRLTRELFQDAVDSFLAGRKTDGKRLEKEQ